MASNICDINSNELVDIHLISELISLPIENILGCYIYGSYVYGTNTATSDCDILVVTNTIKDEVQLPPIGVYDIHLINDELFEKMVRDNHIKAVECLFASPWAQLKPYPIEFVFNESGFRSSVSHTVSNSWVKCKKKLEQGDYHTGIKSLFHSLRIASFGIQLAVEGDIVFCTMNFVWDDLNNKKWSWDEIVEKYQPIRNNIMTQFRKYCNK